MGPQQFYSHFVGQEQKCGKAKEKEALRHGMIVEIVCQGGEARAGGGGM